MQHSPDMMTFFFPVGLLGLIVVLGLVVGVVVLAVNGGRAGRAIAISLSIAVGIVVVLGMMLFSVRVSHPVDRAVVEQRAEVRPQPGADSRAPGSAQVEVSVGVERHADQQPALVEAIVSDTGWAEAPGIADRYPSIRSAAEALARWVAEQLPTDTDRAAPLSVVGDAPDHVRNAVVDALTRHAWQFDPSIVDGKEFTASVPTPALELKFRPQTSGDAQAGTLFASVYQVVQPNLGNQRSDTRIGIVDLPWVEDPGGGTTNGEAVGFSAEPAASAEEARRQALSAAISQLARRAASMHPGISEVECRAVTGRLIDAQGWPVEYFDQTFTRTYGTIHRAAARVHPPSGSVQTIIHHYAVEDAQARAAAVERHAVAVERRDWRRNRFLAGGALIASLFVIYAVLNALTKGYHAWTLRLVTVIILAAGLVFLLMLA